MVDDLVIDVNASLKHKQDNERLKGIIARIESYDIVVRNPYTTLTPIIDYFAVAGD